MPKVSFCKSTAPLPESTSTSAEYRAGVSGDQSDGFFISNFKSAFADEFAGISIFFEASEISFPSGEKIFAFTDTWRGAARVFSTSTDTFAEAESRFITGVVIYTPWRATATGFFTTILTFLKIPPPVYQRDAPITRE